MLSFGATPVHDAAMAGKLDSLKLMADLYVTLRLSSHAINAMSVGWHCTAWTTKGAPLPTWPAYGPMHANSATCSHECTGAKHDGVCHFPDTARVRRCV